MDFYADELEYQSAFYGGPIMNREETRAYLQGWQDAMEDITWEAENYLPGADPETGIPNGSVRTYGTWVGTHNSGATTVSKYYSVTQFNDDGKIVTALEWFDLGGVFDQVESQLQN